MKKILILTALLLASLPGKSQQSMIADEVVAVVGGSMILYSDLVRTMDELAAQRAEMGVTSDREPRCEALETLLRQKLLANQARLDSLEGNPTRVEEMVEGEVNRLLDRYGSQSALEAELHRPVYQIRDDLREGFEDLMLAQTMEWDVRNGVSVIPAEVDRYYRRIDKDSLPPIPEQYVYAQILLYPPSREEARLRAREQLLGLRQRIFDGERFAVLAQMYSRDPASAGRGGESEWTPLEGLVRPFAQALESLRVGQISPVVETEFGFHIIELLEKRGDEVRYRHILIRPEFTQQELAETAQRLDSIGGLIRTGELTFEEAALKYSQDEYTKYNGGEVTNREFIELQMGAASYTSNRFTREQLGEMGGDYNYLRTLKPGEISASFRTFDLRGNQQVKLVKLNEIIPSHRADLREDYTLIESRALQDKQERVYNEWFRKTLAAMYIRINPKYRNCDFQTSGWIK